MEIMSMFWVLASFVILLFIIGIYYLLVTRNLLRILIGMEILTKGVTLLLVAAGYLTGRTNIIQPIIITMIVVEVVIIAVAAGVVIAAYRSNGTVNIRSLRNLKG
ncbi:MAG: NADH-quinone oxidoreductase subunit K [Acidobacteriota bacterium]|jgi:multisubunit Na+/H+ antiporter MnhC subunit|nr:NADH-quinone oxidoreductase subunit K [Acidobacteriota bacterium]